MVFLAIYASILLALLIAAWRYPPTSIAALICVQVIDVWGQLSSPFIAENGRLTNIYIVALLGVALLRTVVRNRRAQFHFRASSYVQIALWSYALISVLWSLEPTIALEQWSLHWPYMVLAVLVAPLIINSYGDAVVAMRALIVLGGILALMVDVFVKWDGRYVVAFWDSNTKIWNALALAQMAGYTALAAALLNEKTNVLWITIRAAAIAACVVLAVKTGSRGQFALMIGLSLLLLPLSRQNKNWRSYLSILVVFVCVLAAAYFAFDYFSGDGERWSKRTFDRDLQGRLWMTTTVMHYWWNAASSNISVMIFGLGNSSSFSPNLVGYYPHDVWIEILAEEGLIGLFLFLALNLIFVRTALRSIHASSGDKHTRGVACALIGMYAYSVLLAFKQGSLLNMSSNIFLYLVLLERLFLHRPSHSLIEKTETKIIQGRYPNLCR